LQGKKSPVVIHTMSVRLRWT